MKSAVHYTRAAEDDLHRIAAYTLELWGEEQRDVYLDVLEQTCEQVLPAYTHIARDAPGHPGLLRWRMESHVIYFREVPDGIEIVRVLHVRMLPSRHL